MPHPLDGALIRVWTAEEHINDLAERIDDLARSHADAAIDKLDLNGLNLSHEFIHEGKWLGAADKMIFDTIQTPILFPAIVGEVCYHLRAGLDYLVYELARYDSGKPRHGTQLPVEQCPLSDCSRTTE